MQTLTKTRELFLTGLINFKVRPHLQRVFQTNAESVSAGFYLKFFYSWLHMYPVSCCCLFIFFSFFPSFIYSLTAILSLILFPVGNLCGGAVIFYLFVLPSFNIFYVISFFIFVFGYSLYYFYLRSPYILFNLFFFIFDFSFCFIYFLHTHTHTHTNTHTSIHT